MMNRYKKYETKDPWPEVPFHEDKPPHDGVFEAALVILFVGLFVATMLFLSEI